MGRDSYMRAFASKHELAFDNHLVTQTASHGLHTDGGLPEQGRAGGQYSTRLSYGEWHRLSCARLAYDEQQENNTQHIFALLAGAINFPWLSISAGALYMLSSVRRTKELFRDNGIQAAKKCTSSKVRVVSVTTLKLVAVASIAKMVMDNFDLEFTGFIK